MQDETVKQEYNVTTVEKTSAPEGMTGDNWYRYVIKRGKQVIDCKKTGTRQAVTEHAEYVAEMISSRHMSGKKKKKS
jgi:hypothetical protein